MKYRIRKTGEIIDVVSFSCLTTAERNEDYDDVDYIDSNGNEILHAPLNIHWDLEPIDEIGNTINWEQRRYEIAKSAMNGILSNEEELSFACSEAKYEENETHTIPKTIAQYAVSCADALIEELKKAK